MCTYISMLLLRCSFISYNKEKKISLTRLHCKKMLTFQSFLGLDVYACLSIQSESILQSRCQHIFHLCVLYLVSCNLNAVSSWMVHHQALSIFFPDAELLLSAKKRAQQASIKLSRWFGSSMKLEDLLPSRHMQAALTDQLELYDPRLSHPLTGIVKLYSYFYFQYVLLQNQDHSCFDSNAHVFLTGSQIFDTYTYIQGYE